MLNGYDGVMPGYSRMESHTEINTNVVPEGSTHISITTVLSYCKSKILNPYLRMLSVVGLRPIFYDLQEPSCGLDLVNYFYTVFVVALMICGYLVHYMSCFRRDRGFCQNVEHDLLTLNQVNRIYDKTCDGSLFFAFVVPTVLHLLGYLHAMLIFRRSDDDQFPILMERVFISSSNLPNAFAVQRKLVRKLWCFILISAIWMLLSTASVNGMMAIENVTFKWIPTKKRNLIKLTKIVLVVCTLWHDVIQATIVTNYCLQAQLLTSYLQFLRSKLLQYPTQPLEWMRDIEDFKKILQYFNQQIAPSVCLFTITNLVYAIAGILWLLDYDTIDRETFPVFGLSAVNVALWVLIAVAPFVQASRITNACDLIKTAGQEAQIRPFVHQDTPTYELDSLLMYTSSLKLEAKLFCMPIYAKYLWFLVISATVLIMVLGQCHYLI